MGPSAVAACEAFALCLFAGCATPGPLHVYSLATTGERNVLDSGEGRNTLLPSFLAPDDAISGFAYDPFTDHFFLRLEPGHRIRVVDRPARAIKREFEIAHPASKCRGDLTVRPRDGHLFLLGAEPRQVIETSRLGKVVRTFMLADVGVAPAGIAFDTVRDRLVVLGTDGLRITIHDLQGAPIGGFAVAQAAAPSLGFDAEKRELYAPLRDQAGAIGVFDETGRLLRTSAAGGAFVDVGQRSFLRVF